MFAENPPPHLIDEEVVCVDALRHVIRRLSSSTIVEIHREVNDPPDFTVTINGRAFPAEVTSVVSDEQYHAHIRELGRQVGVQAINRGVLIGTYAIRFSRRPSIPRPKSLERRDLTDAALRYIEDTRERAECPETILRTDREGKIFIVKLSRNGARVGVLWSRALWREHQIRDELLTLLQAAVDSKRLKLSKAGIQGQSALLLLYDAFGYAEPYDAVAALEQVSGYDWFHSVFWAASFTDRSNVTMPSEPGREGMFLYSVDEAWHRSGTVAVPASESSGVSSNLNRNREGGSD